MDSDADSPLTGSPLWCVIKRDLVRGDWFVEDLRHCRPIDKRATGTNGAAQAAAVLVTATASSESGCIIQTADEILTKAKPDQELQLRKPRVSRPIRPKWRHRPYEKFGCL